MPRNDDIDAWTPRAGEQAFLQGTGRRCDFASVQTVLETADDAVLLTGGWMFEKRDGAWRTHSSADILLRSAPHLNQDADRHDVGIDA